jgi:histidine phosphotransferase ChpT
MALFRSKPAPSADAPAVPRSSKPAGHKPTGNTPTGMPVQVAELLFSKMSHDLASPVGAAENGLELLAEDAGGMQDEALAMVRDSAHTVASRLKFYRLAYGTPGGNTSMGAAELGRLITDFYASMPRLHFTMQTLEPETSPLLKKLLLNLILCGSDSLPRGGTLVAAVSGGELVVTAASADTTRPPRTGVVVTGPKAPPPAELTPYTVQGWYTGWYAWRNHLRISETLEGATLTLRVRSVG